MATMTEQKFTRDEVVNILGKYKAYLKTDEKTTIETWFDKYILSKKEKVGDKDFKNYVHKNLELPKYVKANEVLKSDKINKPDISTLTDEQLEIFNVVTNIDFRTFSQTLLTGYSGTGKSFLVSKIIEEILFKNKTMEIAITAPTNKAVRVLKNLSNISEKNKRIYFNTLHSLLGLRRFITEDGREEYKASDGGEIEDYDLIIVDEVSMLDNELYDMLIKSAKTNKIPIIFIGDRGQIPPVNGGESLLFSKKLDNNFNLTRIIRQGQNNPIVALAQKIRLNEEFLPESVLDDNNNGVVYVKLNTETPLLEKYFNSPNFNEDPNFIKVLCWTNKAVDYYNKKIRELIYGVNTPKLCIGEKMVCNKPITDSSNKILLNNNDEFVVESFVLKTEKNNPDLTYYSVKIKSSGTQYTIKILSDESQDAYEKEIDKLKNKALKSNSYEKRNAWVKYYNFMERYADVKYNYALTVHKAQGSTFENAIVINCDIARIKNAEERNKLLYTAITRAKSKLFII
jgi:exodeoxyribonuclease-5